MTRIQDQYALDASQMTAASGGALRGATGDTGATGATGATGSAGPATPTLVASGATFAAAAGTQVLFRQTVRIDGTAKVDGTFIEVPR